MTGHVELRPEAMPLCGPADTIELIGAARRTGRHADCREWTYVAVHRGHGLWTHVYDVVQLPGPFGNEIRLIRVLPGDRRAEARSWALARKERILPARPKAGDTASAGSPVNTNTGVEMPLTRRALISSAAVASLVAPLAVPVRSRAKMRQNHKGWRLMDGQRVAWRRKRQRSPHSPLLIRRRGRSSGVQGRAFG